MLRRMFIVMAIGLMTVIVTVAQVDSSFGYYPLKIGNLWQYHYHYRIYRGTYLGADSLWHTRYDSLSTFVLVKVSGDTVMPNGLRYFRIEPSDSYQYFPYRTVGYRRLDSSTANVYENLLHSDPPRETLLDSLRARKGDWVMSSFYGMMKCLSFDTMTVLGVHTNGKVFDGGYGMAEWHTLVYGFGLAQWVMAADNEVYPLSDYYYSDLIYARIFGEEFGTLVGVHEVAPALPRGISLEQNYPNPFNPTTTIRYGLPSRSHVTLSVFNTLGQQVATLVNESQEAGYHDVRFDGRGLASGVYFYRMSTGTYVETKTLLLIR